MINILLLAATVAAPAEFPVPEIQYTEDSVIKEGVTCTLEEVVLGEESAYYLTVNVDLPLGYTIYDDTETEGIEGITVGETILPDSYILSDLDYTKLLTINVKTVYSKGAAGVIAAINDGTYDYAQLLASPIAIMQGVYYVVSAVGLVLGGFGLFKSAKEKAKTAKEWEKVADEHLKTTIEEVKTECLNTINKYLTTDFRPLIEQCLSNDQNIIKAIALQTSKSKEAPTAILELLAKISTDVDAVKIINEANKSIKSAEEAKLKAAEEVKKSLAEISKVNTVKTDSLEGRY